MSERKLMVALMTLRGCAHNGGFDGTIAAHSQIENRLLLTDSICNRQ